MFTITTFAIASMISLEFWRKRRGRFDLYWLRFCLIMLAVHIFEYSMINFGGLSWESYVMHRNFLFAAWGLGTITALYLIYKERISPPIK